MQIETRALLRTAVVNSASNRGLRGDSPLLKSVQNKLSTESEGRSPAASSKMCQNQNVTAVAATPPLNPLPRTPSSLPWDKLQDHSEVATHPLLFFVRKSTPPGLIALWPVIFSILSVLIGRAFF